MNAARFAAAPASTFDSIYQAKQALSVVQKQRFVEWFSGDALDSIWTKTGSGTVAMDDAIDGGLKITTASGSTDIITFNDIRQYDFDAAVLIAIMKMGGNSSQFGVAGFAADVSNSHEATIGMNTDQSTSFFLLKTRATGSATYTNSSVSLDTNFHAFKVENKASSVDGIIAGVVEATNTTNLPTSKQQPVFDVGDRATGGKNASIRYLEAYNT